MGCWIYCISRVFCNYLLVFTTNGGLVAQAVRRLPPTAGVPSSHLGSSMWVSWWTKRGLGRFFLGLLPFSPTTNFVPLFFHIHLIHFISFHQPLWWCVRRGRPAPSLFTDLQCWGFIASHPSTRPCVGHELRILFIYYEDVGWLVLSLVVFTPKQSPRYSFYRRLSGPQDQSGHKGAKKNLHPSNTRDWTRAVQPVAKRLATWATWPMEGRKESIIIIMTIMGL